MGSSGASAEKTISKCQTGIKRVTASLNVIAMRQWIGDICGSGTGKLNDLYMYVGLSLRS